MTLTEKCYEELPRKKKKRRRQLQSFLDGSVIRATIAVLTLVIYAGTIGGAFLYVDSPKAWPNVKELLQIVIPVETLILGGVVGHFFGGRDHGTQVP